MAAFRKLLRSLFVIFVLLASFALPISAKAANVNVRIGEAINYPNGFTYMTHYFYMNDTLAFCLEPRLGPMAEGSYEAIEVSSEGSEGYPLLVRVLACGYGGPNDLTGVFFPGASERDRYIYTHIAAGYAYLNNSQMDGKVHDITGLSAEEFEACGLGDFVRAAWDSGYEGTVRIVRVNGYQDIGYLASYEEPGWTLRIKKSDVETGAYLSGAIYGVYSDPDCNNQIATIAATDSNGNSSGKIKKQYSKVYVKEVKAPKGYVKDENVYEVDKYDDVTVEMTDLRYKVKLRFNKTDSRNSNTILNNLTPKAVFDIVDPSTGVTIASDITIDENGYAITSDVIPSGRYEVIEKVAPRGYRKSTTPFIVEFYDDTDTVMDDSISEKVLPVVIPNTPIEGKLKLYKEGEMLVDVVKGDEKKGTDAKFKYEKKPMSGIKFDLFAAEDIYEPDGSLDSNGKRNIVYKKDEKIATITTDANGIATYSDHNKPLYIGKYYVTEVGVPKGYVKNTNKYEFVVDDSQADVDYESRVDVENIRSKFSVKISKNDIRRTTYLKGAEFGLYAYEDILSFDGKVLVSKDEFLGKCTSGSDGKGTFKPDLCEGRYYIKELKSPEGYIMSSEAKTVILKGDEVHEYNNSTIEFANEKINEPTENKITTNAKIVKGATQSRVVKTNYRTEDNGEEGYSIVLSAADIGESAVDSRVYALALFVLVVVITSVSVAAKERVGGRKND